MPVVTINVVGTGAWVKPYFVTEVIIECWGAGGAGAGVSAANTNGGGGAGGQYAKKTITYAKGYEKIPYTIGQGGAAGFGSGPAGGDTTWGTNVVVAKGGAGGTTGPTNGNGSGGTGSTAGGVGDIVYAGGSGSDGLWNATKRYGGNGGGGAGSTGSGNNGGTVVVDQAATGGAARTEFGGAGGNGFITDGINDRVRQGGFQYGGGGGGNANDSTALSVSGGDGNGGFLRITYTVPANFRSIAIAGTGSLVVPADWNNNDNIIEAIGWGGSGQTGLIGSSGGGGGAYAATPNFTLTPGSTAFYAVETSPGDVWFNKTSNAKPTTISDGILAKSGVFNDINNLGGAGGSALDSVGTIKFSGGTGGQGSLGVSGAGGGGGGAAGPFGEGATGGEGDPTATGDDGGGGGGGAGGGTSGGAGTTSGGAGGNGPTGFSDGDPGGIAPGIGFPGSLLTQYDKGTGGGGGGGVGPGSGGTAPTGGFGQTGCEYLTPTSTIGNPQYVNGTGISLGWPTFFGAGGGGGGTGSNGTTDPQAGSGGLFGGGGGGMTQQVGFAGVGANGLLLISYLATESKKSNMFFLF